MGAYRYLDGTSADTNGIIRTADGAIVRPPPTGSPPVADWTDYLAWKAVPNTPDASTALSLSSAKRAKKREFDVQAMSYFSQDLRLQAGDAAACGGMIAVLLEELYRYENDGTPSAADYPLLDALIGEEGVDLAAVAGNIRTWWDGVKDRVAETFANLWTAHKDVNGAANVSAVAAVTMGTPTGGGAGE
jgi:hypothetical protein